MSNISRLKEGNKDSVCETWEMSWPWDLVTLSFTLPMIYWCGCAFWMWEGASNSEMISSSTRDASTAGVVEVVAWGAPALSVKVGTSSGDDVERHSESSSSPSKPYSSSSIKMLSHHFLVTCTLKDCHTRFLSQNWMLIVCVPRNQVYTHTIQKMDIE
jgi:hypothetical protein